MNTQQQRKVNKSSPITRSLLIVLLVLALAAAIFIPFAILRNTMFAQVAGSSTGSQELPAMVAIYITSMSGWIMMVLLIVTAIYPFLLRPGVLGPVQPFLKRMRFHYWLGYTLATVVVIHAWLPMSARLAGVVNEVGLYLGTIALLLIFAQVMLGRRLSWPKLPIRRMLRRWHFWVMVGIGVFVLGHIILDSPTVQLFISRLTT